MFVGVGGCPREYATELEAQLCRTDVNVRIAQIHCLCFYLDINCAHLTQQYSPAQLLQLTPEALARGSNVEEQTLEHKAKLQERNALLARDFLTDATERCSNVDCRSTNINYEQRQTRSGDEGYTTFACCVDCGRKWKFA